MRVRTYWEEGVEVIKEDLNAIHDSTENEVKVLLEALSGGKDTLLFDNAPPAVSVVPPNIVVDVPAQRFSVDGNTGEVPAPVTLNFPDTPTAQHRVFFVIRRNETTDTRDFLEESGGTLAVVPDTAVIRKTTADRIEQTSSPDELTPASDPTLSPDDIGFVEYCTIIWDGATLTTTLNVAALYTFPGAGMGYASHGIQHLPGGTDPIPVAAVSGSPSGSDPGLMPAGSFAVLKNAVQSVSIDAASPFLTRVTTGDNTPTNPKNVELNLRLMPALIGVEDSGDWYLGLSYGSGPYAGDSPNPARFNHRHPISEIPLAIVPYDVDVDSSDLGTLLDVAEFPSIGVISHTQVYWVPPGKTYPMVDCDWAEMTAGSVGVKAHVVGNNEIKLEIGELGMVRLTDALKTYVTGITGGITWESQDNGRIVQSGKLMVRLFGER